MTNLEASERLAHLSPEQRRVLLQKLVRERTSAPDERIPRRAGDEPAPLSFAQRRLWVVEQLEPGSTAYHMAGALRLRGPVDVDALRRALDAVVARHQALRTVFEERGGEPVQVIVPAGPVPLPMADLRHLPAEARHAELRRLSGAGHAPFDLARGPLLRASLARMADDEHVLLFTLHHIVSDGWSMGVLGREVSALYAAYSTGAEPGLPELPVQYADFAAWQRRRLTDDALARELAYWKTRLAGAPPLLQLPTDRPRAAGAGAAAGTVAFDLPADAVAALAALAQRQGATLFMTLLAAWQTLLARYAAQDDVVVGSPVAGRPRAELEGLIGFFVNMLPLRASVTGDASFAELLGQVRESTLEAFAHQNLPFERVVEELAPERSLSHAPVFQAVFTLERGDAGGDLALAGGGIDTLPVDEGSSKFDLLLACFEEDDRVSAVLTYRASLFDAATMERMAEHFTRLLRAVAADPDRPLREVEMLSAAERERVLVEWNATASAYPRESVGALFSQQAAATPEAVAVASADGTLTYAELDARSNRIARQLRARGVDAGARVGIALERSAELVAVLLGVLKAGGSYVPLDAEYPAERLAFMCGDAELALVVVAGPLPDALAGWSGAVLSLAGEAAGIAAQPPTAPEGRTDAGAEAYVVYTSGSTGTPKGVAVPHRAIVRLVRGSHFIGFGPEHTFLQLAPVAFDASTLELWGALLNGGRLAVYPAGPVDPAALGRFLREREVTTAWLTAGLFHQMADAELAALGVLRQLLAGGDVLSPAHCRRVLEAHPGLRLVNGYGPTENTTFTCCHTIRLEELEGAVPVGRPVSNTRVYVLDGAGKPAGVGVAGELYAAGDGVALGYVNRPELTAERFLEIEIEGVGRERAYRTGDRVRWREDGAIDFLGRVDEQVKVRGFRVEPGEVEAALRLRPGVRDAAVVARAGAGGERILVAYVVGDAPAAAELRAALRESLPDYMVPSAYVVLDALPLNANGKVDRRALPEPGLDGAAGYAPPSTPTEEIVAGIWAEVLEHAGLGVHDNFFEVGGHSLLATQVIARVREAFALDVPLRVLFEQPTIAAFAAAVDSQARDVAGQGTPPLERAPRGVPVPLSFAQRRLWFIEQMEPGTATYNLFHALRIRGPLDVAALERSLAALMERHEILRTGLEAGAGEPVQVVRPVPSPVLTHVELGGLGAGEREARALELARASAVKPFDLAHGPLLRAKLVSMGGGDHILFLGMHHIAGDEWSMRLLVRELSDGYQARAAGAEPHAEPLAVQYGDYAVWQRAWLTDEVLEAQLGYWRHRLAGAPPLLGVPTDRPRAAGRSQEVGVSRFQVPPTTAGALRALGIRAGATLHMTLLAAWKLLLARYAGESEVVVGTPVGGRSHRELEDVIGFFVNMLALRTDLSGDPTFGELLGRVRETTLGAYAHQDLPFERLVDSLAAGRDLTHAPLFQVVFNLHRRDARDSLRLGSLATEAFGRAAAFNPYDLDLTIVDSNGALAGALSFQKALFDAATADAMAAHFLALLEAIAAGGDARIGELALMDDAARLRVLRRGEGPAAPPATRWLHERFAAHAAEWPGAPALLHAGAEVSYAELDRRARGMAGRLRALGVGPEVRVGVCLERTPAWVATVLGVWKAGGVYVPLDPSYPAERLAYMLADSGATHLVTARGLGERVPSFAGPVLRVDEDEVDGVDTMDGVALPGHAAAYVIYTSGSTGRPKGVVVEHAGLGNLAQAHGRGLAPGRGGRVFQFSSISFDASMWELAMSLGSGAALQLPEPGTLLAGAELLRQLGEGAATTLTLPPSTLATLPHAALPELRTLIVAGEACGAELARRWSAGRRFVNAYGPTESTVAVTYALATPQGEVPGIGTPLENVRAYVLDGGGRAVPEGVAGELYAGGAGVARGYLGRPALTAEKFVPDAFSGEAGARLYRTGDRVRWTAGGGLEFLGRVDAQVKVRGYRIEPGEIEAVLREQAGVSDAAVVVREDAPGDRRVVAYVVGTAGVAELRAGAQARLPGFMVPSAIVVMDALPTTPNGKVDRRALPAPEAGAADAGAAPRTPTEELLCGIWADVLDLEAVGIHDNFFELGGHSLLVTQVVARVQQVIGADIPVRVVFEQPTVAELAAYVDAEAGAGLEEWEMEEELERLADLSDDDVKKLLGDS